MLDVIGTKLTMWIFSNMWFYTVIDVVLLILIIMLFKKFGVLSKKVSGGEVHTEEKKSVFDKMPAMTIPKPQKPAPVIEEEIVTQEGVFDQILAKQEKLENPASKSVPVENNLHTPQASSVQQPLGNVHNSQFSAQTMNDTYAQQPVSPMPQPEPVMQPYQQQMQSQMFDQQISAAQMSQPDFTDYNVANSHLSQQKVDDQPFVTASSVQEQYNHAQEFKPFDASQIEFKPTPSYEDMLQSSRNQNYTSQPQAQQPVNQFADTVFSEPVFTENNPMQNIKIEKEEYVQPQQQFQQPNDFSQMAEQNVNQESSNEREIEEELKTLVQVKRHLIDKIKYYNGLIQQLDLQPDGPEKAMKREEIASQLKRIKAEFEEYNEIEREVLEHAKNNVR